MKFNRCLITLIFAVMAFLSSASNATIYNLNPNGDVIGEVVIVKTWMGDSFQKISRHFKAGYHELIEANPAVNPNYVPRGTELVIPTKFILPNTPHEGMVINLAELRIYQYMPETNQVMTSPIGIGRQGWLTPLGKMTIIEKIKDPSWYVPKSVQMAQRELGNYLPTIIPPGPMNPLGRYAIRLSERTYLIHGTNDPSRVGQRVTAGCMRMYPEEVKVLFSLVDLGQNVRIINEPLKLGWVGNQLYLESHVPLLEQQHIYGEDPRFIFEKIQEELQGQNVTLNWAITELVVTEHTGVPAVIGRRA